MDASLNLVQADTNKQSSVPGAPRIAQDHIQDASRAVREQLATPDQATWGGAGEAEVGSKFVSPSDPAASGPVLCATAVFAYAIHDRIDAHDRLGPEIKRHWVNGCLQQVWGRQPSLVPTWFMIVPYCPFP